VENLSQSSVTAARMDGSGGGRGGGGGGLAVVDVVL